MLTDISYTARARNAGLNVHFIAEADRKGRIRLEENHATHPCCNCYSVAKAFTVTAVGMLYDRGLLEPDMLVAQLLTIPEEATAVAVQGDAGTIYLCDGFEVTAQVLRAGDLSRTFRDLTGFESDGLTVMATAAIGWTRYECVWTSAGEQGDTVGRAVILDDGVYHYCLTLTADADDMSGLQDIFQKIINSYSLA